MQLLEDFEDVDYALVGIHSTIEDYRLAYLLNNFLKTKLTRLKNDLDFGNSNAEFPLFEYKDETNFTNYYLINNKHKELVENTEDAGLFGGSLSTKISYLIPEKSKIDYFLKIDGCYCDSLLNKLLEELKKINQIITSYLIEPTTLKSKNNLIF